MTTPRKAPSLGNLMKKAQAEPVQETGEIPTPKVNPKPKPVPPKTRPPVNPTQFLHTEKEEILPEEGSKSVEELLDLLFKASIDERQRKILNKYKKEMADFERILGTPNFLKALTGYMLEQIEGKIVASR